MTAKIIPFGRRPSRKLPDPLKDNKECRDGAIDMLLNLAMDIEDGEVEEVFGAIIYTDGTLDNFSVAPRSPTKLVKAIDQLKKRVLEQVEECGPR